MKLGRRNSDFESCEGIDLDVEARNIVVDLKQRFLEDPEFATGFGRAIASARTQHVEDMALASLALNDDFEDPSVERPLTDEVLAERLEASDKIITLVGAVAEGHLRPEEFIKEIRGAIGNLARIAYMEGELQVHPSLRDEGVLGIADPEFGMIVVLDRWNKHIGGTEAME